MAPKRKLTAREILHRKGETVAYPLEHGDIFCILAHHTEAWGDPLDRAAKNIEVDLNRDLLSPEVTQQIYGASASQKDGKWTVDVAAMEKARQKMRKEREAKSVPASEWWKAERETVLKKDFPEITVPLFADGLANEKWGRKWKGFWALPENYSV
jgi:hypothetical protein